MFTYSPHVILYCLLGNKYINARIAIEDILKNIGYHKVDGSHWLPWYGGGICNVTLSREFFLKSNLYTFLLENPTYI